VFRRGAEEKGDLKNMRVKLKLRIPSRLDEWMWKHVRWYRRREMRRRELLRVMPFEFAIKPQALRAAAETSRALLTLQLAKAGYTPMDVAVRCILADAARCAFCGEPIDQPMLRNGATICMSCQDGFR